MHSIYRYILGGGYLSAVASEVRDSRFPQMLELQVVVNCLQWMLGPEHRFFASETNTLNC